MGRGGCCPQWTLSQHFLLMFSLNLPPNYPPLSLPPASSILALTLIDEEAGRPTHKKVFFFFFSPCSGENQQEDD